MGIPSLFSETNKKIKTSICRLLNYLREEKMLKMKVQMIVTIFRVFMSLQK